jgi:CheY-like chemotaxis protein
MSLDTFDDFAQSLSEALTHLYDPAYHPPQDLMTVLAATQPQATGSVQQMIVSAIQHLQPDAEVPPTARSRRLYELLTCRYVQELTQEETAERLSITSRHLRREQKQAVNLLAQNLWMRWCAIRAAQPTAAMSEVGKEQSEMDWRSQVHQELAVLEGSDPGAIADVSTVIEQVVQLKEKAGMLHDAALVVAPFAQGIEAAIHPSVLRQLLIIAIQKLAQAMTHGLIHLHIVPTESNIQILISGTPIHATAQVSSEFIAQTVTARGGEFQVEQRGDTVEFHLRLPRVQRATLLVVDDNEDIIHVYRRYLERTRFRVVHVNSGEAVFEQIKLVRPDIILLDVMLPDMDGWEVLTRLHENVETRTLPIIVCSVIRQEELALALGAALYVSKPVRRADLIQALEQVLAQSSKADPTMLKNTAKAY